MSLRRQNATGTTKAEDKATEKKKNKTPIKRGGGPDKKNRRTLDKYQEDFEDEEDEQWISNNTISDPFPEAKVKQKIHPEYGKLRY
tara:strand:+ start:227 stop:484 length:258 start_codon:yes stop_codon:yes gene_type:complete